MPIVVYVKKSKSNIWFVEQRINQNNIYMPTHCYWDCIKCDIAKLQMCFIFNMLDLYVSINL